ncbi:hypothetical protein QBC41DRAFT_49490 [Cercophora samala]|uniref:Uncharacterized protein n=1 Tax=Cercophora samala TaxID=330535 RepID=A0AA39ZIU3_9PEZI|nr:hypothetical protein QBC41DRAFT_49490 [Cercophora samala]
MLCKRTNPILLVLLTALTQLSLAGIPSEDAMNRPTVLDNGQPLHATTAQQEQPVLPSSVKATDIPTLQKKAECPACDCLAICAGASTTTITPTSTPSSGSARREILVMANRDDLHSPSVTIDLKAKSSNQPNKNPKKNCPNCDFEHCGCGHGSGGALLGSSPRQAAGIAVGMGCVAAIAAGGLF